MMHKKTAVFYVVALALVFWCKGSYSQVGDSSQTKFQAVLSELSASCLRWKNTIGTLKLDRLPVGYAEGKVLEANVQTAEQNLSLACYLSARLSQSGLLSDEITLMEAVSGFSQNLQELSANLMSINSLKNDEVKQIVGWANSFSSLANGPVNSVYLRIYNHALHSANEIQARANACNSR